jgi:hypothetical protein
VAIRIGKRRHLRELSQERLPGRQRQNAQNCLQPASRFGRDGTSPISTRKSPKVRGLRDSIRDFGDYEECVVADAVVVEPVSTTKFPANREFFNFGPDRAKGSP